MIKYSFKNDYSEGAHPQILDRLVQTNYIQQQGYGEDAYSKEAKVILRQKIANDRAGIYFLSGGTQTNLIVISSLLRVHEAVISAKTGHIYANETGAIEATGHRIIPVETEDGKLSPHHIEKVLHEHKLRPHVVKPKMVYISNATELGSVYTKSELQHLYSYCQCNDLILFMDGARLGHALTAKQNDLSLEEVAALTDVFYIGGTKNGALLGEAVVFKDPALAQDFDYILKQKGALLAKGRVLGIGFLELFKQDLYFSLAEHANNMALQIADYLRSRGYMFLSEPVTNQLFPVLPVKLIAHLGERYDFYKWKEVDAEHTAVRLITSWTTQPEIVASFIDDIESY